MYTDAFNKFLASQDTLQVYQGEQLIFASVKDGLLPWLEYLGQLAPYHHQVVVFDKIMGNAAALLAIKAGCRQVYSPLGSQMAVETLARHGIRCHLIKVVPYIQKAGGAEMCPMEKLSLGKGAAEFYEVLRKKPAPRAGHKTSETS